MPIFLASRLHNGKTSRFSAGIDEIYKKIFDPEEPGSLAFSENPKELLERLKEVIQKNGLSDATKDLHDSDYKTYVKELLRLAKKMNLPDQKKKNVFVKVLR